jgi:lambda family phage tail tape measure protein
MATIDNYKIQVDVQGQQAVDKLKNSLGGLGTAIAGIGFAAFTNSVLQMADAVSDLSAATGLSIGNIAAFGGALGQAGGKAEDAGKMIGKFFQTLDDAAQGSDKAQEALKRVGFNLSDLTTMSEGQLLTKALSQLSQMEAGAKRTALGVEIFGKSFKSIDPKVLADAFASGDFSKAEEALKKMGDLADTLSANMHTLQIAGAQVFSEMATAIEPFIGKIENSRLSLEQAEKIIKAVGIGIAVAFGAKTVATIIEIVAVVKALTTALKGTVIVQTALTALSGPRGWAIIAAGAVAATAAVVGLNKALEDTNSEVEKATGGKPAEANKGPAFATVKMSAKDKAANQAAVAAMAVTEQLKLQNSEANKLREITISTIGMESSLSSVIKNNADIRAKTANEILDLENKIKLERQKGEDSNPRVITELQKQIGLKKEQLTATLALNEAEYQRNLRLQEVTTAIGTDAMLASRQKDLDLMRQQVEFGTAITLEDQTQLKLMALQNEEAKKRIDLTKELKLAQAAGNQVAIDDIQLRMSEDAKYYEQRRQLEQKAYEVQIARRQDSVAGAKTAMEQITRSMDPFMLAQNATTSMFQNMNSAIDNFVNTGKFKFSDFARSVIQDLAKMALKAQATKLFGSLFGDAGGIFGSLFKAEGGPVKGNQPYIVGEKGPELFVPPGAGKIIPNNQMAARASTPSMGNAPITNTYITNNVSAIDSKSVAEFFATNRRTMLGTMQLAQKELPYGNR